MGIVLVVSFVAGTLLAYFVSHMYQRVALLNIACGGSAVCTGLYAAAAGLQQLFAFNFLADVGQSLAMPSLFFLTEGSTLMKRRTFKHVYATGSLCWDSASSC